MVNLPASNKRAVLKSPKDVVEMPLSMMGVGAVLRIKMVGGSESVRRHLGDMGFVEGAEVMIVAEMAGSLIVGIHETRVALNRELAQKILV